MEVAAPIRNKKGGNKASRTNWRRDRNNKNKWNCVNYYDLPPKQKKRSGQVDQTSIKKFTHEQH